MTPRRAKRDEKARLRGNTSHLGTKSSLAAVDAARRLLCLDLFLRNASYREAAELLGISHTAVMGYVKAVIGPIQLSRARRHKEEVRKAYLTEELWRALWPKILLLADEAKGRKTREGQPRFAVKNYGEELATVLRRFDCYNLHMEGLTCLEIGERLGMSKTAVSEQLVTLAGRVRGRIRIRSRAQLRNCEPAVRELARTGLLPAMLGKPLAHDPVPVHPAFRRMLMQRPVPPELEELAVSAGYLPAPVRKVDVAQELSGKLSAKPEVSYWGANAGLEPVVAERKRRIQELLNEGWTYKRIGKELGISAPAVHRYVQAITGLDYPRKPPL